MKTPLIVLLLVMLAGCASVPPAPPAPTPDDIVAMSRAGDSDATIITRLRDSQALYALPASALVDLSKRGVSEAVLDYMQQTWLAAERRRAYWEARELFWQPLPLYRYSPRYGWRLGYH